MPSRKSFRVHAYCCSRTCSNLKQQWFFKIYPKRVPLISITEHIIVDLMTIMACFITTKNKAPILSEQEISFVQWCSSYLILIHLLIINKAWLSLLIGEVCKLNFRVCILTHCGEYCSKISKDFFHFKYISVDINITDHDDAFL